MYIIKAPRDSGSLSTYEGLNFPSVNHTPYLLNGKGFDICKSRNDNSMKQLKVIG